MKGLAWGFFCPSLSAAPAGCLVSSDPGGRFCPALAEWRCVGVHLSGLPSSIIRCVPPKGLLGTKPLKRPVTSAVLQERPMTGSLCSKKRWFLDVAVTMPHFSQETECIFEEVLPFYFRNRKLLKVSQTADRRRLASGSLSFLLAGFVSVGSCPKPPSLCVFLDFWKAPMKWFLMLC